MSLILSLFGFMSLGSSLGRIGIGTQGEIIVIPFYLLQEDGASHILLEDGTGAILLE